MTIQTKEKRNQILDHMIVDNDYEGIRDQDGWETLTLTVKCDYPDCYDAILVRLASTMPAHSQTVDHSPIVGRATIPVVDVKVVELEMTNKVINHGAVKGMVKDWTWSDMSIVQAHFAIEGTLNTIRANLSDTEFEHDMWSYAGLTRFVMDCYEELLENYIVRDESGFHELQSLIEEEYDNEIEEINNRVRVLNQKDQNWAYLGKLLDQNL